MPLRTQVTCIIVAAVAVWATWLAILGREDLTISLLAPLGATITTVTLAAVLFEKLVWKWSWLRAWLVERPNLQGTWKARLKSNFKGPDGKHIEKDVYVVIRQTLTSLTLRLYSDKARSVSIASSLYQEAGDLFCLSIAYQNVPDVELRNGESEIHYGAALFSHIDWVNKAINGTYWTDRDTRGSLVLERHSSECVSSYADASALFFPKALT